MESQSSGQSSNSLHVFQTPPSSLRRNSDTPASTYGPWQVDTLDETLNQLPSQRDDGSPDVFTSLDQMQIEPLESQPGLLKWAWNGLANRLWRGSQVSKPEQTVSQIPPPPQEGAIPRRQGVITRLITRYVPGLLPYWQFDRTAVKWGAKKLRTVLDEKAGVKFDLKDEVWQKLLEDIILRAASELVDRRVETDQLIEIPKITINTPGGDVVISNVRLNARLQPFHNDCPILGHQKKVISLHVNRLNCNVKIPVKDRPSVNLRITATNGEINFGTDLLDMVLNPDSRALSGLMNESLNGPHMPRDNTAVQFKAESLKVHYTDAKAMFAMNGNLLPADNDEDTLMAGFDGGVASFSNITLNRQLNLFKKNLDQTSQILVGGMEFRNDPSREAVINLDSIKVDELDDYHNGTLSCNVTLKPRHLKLSSSRLWRLVGNLFDGLTTLEVKAPVQNGEIEINKIKLSRKEWEKKPPHEAQNTGYVEVTSSNIIIKTLLGPLLRSRFTKIVPSSCPRLQLGLPFLRVELQLPGFVPNKNTPGDDGNIIVTELLDQIGGDLLSGWYLIPSKLMLTQKNIEERCFAASQGDTEAARHLMLKHIELKRRGHHDEALRTSLAIPTASYQTLIAECERPHERAEYYLMAHELTEVDPPRAVAIYAALLAKQHYSEEPKTSDPAWLVNLAWDIDTNKAGSNATITDILAFAYKSDPFAGVDGLKELCRLASEGRYPKEHLTDLVLNHVRAGKFDDDPKALANTVVIIEEFVGSDIMRVLQEYPVKPLANQARLDGNRDSTARELTDAIVGLMERYEMAVNACHLYLYIGETDNAKSVLEEAIRRSDVMAFKERIDLEVHEGRIGRPRYVQAATILKNVLSTPNLSPEMTRMGKHLLEELWNHSHSHLQVAEAFFSDSRAVPQKSPYSAAVSCLFDRYPPDEDARDALAIWLDETRTLLLVARDNPVTTAQEKLMIGHFSNLLNDIQYQQENLSHAGMLRQRASLLQGSSTEQSNPGYERQAPGVTAHLAYPNTRRQPGYQVLPEWLTEQTTRGRVVPEHE